jgi:hypothetical protein
MTIFKDNNKKEIHKFLLKNCPTISSRNADPMNCGIPASRPFVVNHTSDAFAA